MFNTNSVRFILAAALVCSTTISFAGATPAPTPSTPQDGGPNTTIEVNPHELQALILKKNLNIEAGLQALYVAKANVNVASANLMPSLKLDLGHIGNIFSFAVETISALVPFLIPSNWMLLNEANEQYKAEGVGYYITKLNNVASIYGLYYTLVSDAATYDAVSEQQTMASQIFALVQANYHLGVATQTDLEQAKENLDAANARVSAAEAAVKSQNLAILQLIDMDPETQLKIDVQHEDPSTLEGKTIDQIGDLTIKTSPEWIQAQYLIAAAQANVKVTEFSWLNQFTLSSAAGANGETSSLSRFSGDLSFQIGPALIPNVNLSKIQVSIADTQQQIVRNSQQYAIGYSVENLQAALAQLDYYQDAESSSRIAYNDYLAKYKAGSTDLLHLFSAQTDLLTQIESRILQQAAVDDQRVSLKRIGREADFATVKQCDLDGLGKKKGLFKKIGGVFSKAQLSVDQACASTNQEPDISSDNQKK